MPSPSPTAHPHIPPLIARLSNRLVDVLRWQLANSPRRGGPTIPEGGEVIWSIFLNLNRGRTSNGWGPNPISYQEIETYCRLHRWPLRPHHVEILRALDDAYLQHAGARANQGDGKTIPQLSEQAISPTAFDAVFGQ